VSIEVFTAAAVTTSTDTGFPRLGNCTVFSADSDLSAVSELAVQNRARQRP
jgi:hypothetical protein